MGVKALLLIFSKLKYNARSTIRKEKSKFQELHVSASMKWIKTFATLLPMPTVGSGLMISMNYINVSENVPW